MSTESRPERGLETSREGKTQAGIEELRNEGMDEKMEEARRRRSSRGDGIRAGAQRGKAGLTGLARCSSVVDSGAFGASGASAEPVSGVALAVVTNRSIGAELLTVKSLPTLVYTLQAATSLRSHHASHPTPGLFDPSVDTPSILISYYRLPGYQAHSRNAITHTPTTYIPPPSCEPASRLLASMHLPLDGDPRSSISTFSYLYQNTGHSSVECLTA